MSYMTSNNILGTIFKKSFKFGECFSQTEIIVYIPYLLILLIANFIYPVELLVIIQSFHQRFV